MHIIVTVQTRFQPKYYTYQLFRHTPLIRILHDVVPYGPLGAVLVHHIDDIRHYFHQPKTKSTHYDDLQM